MLPSPADLRELSEHVRMAVPHARTDKMKQLLAGHAFRLVQLAEQLERDSVVTSDAYVHGANVERYECLLHMIMDERARRTIEALLDEENAACGRRRSSARALSDNKRYSAFTDSSRDVGPLLRVP
jgi:hypothetical protein